MSKFERKAKRKKKRNAPKGRLTPQRAKWAVLNLHGIDQGPFWQVPRLIYEKRSLENVGIMTASGLLAGGQLMADPKLFSITEAVENLRRFDPDIIGTMRRMLDQNGVPVWAFINRRQADTFDGAVDFYVFNHCLRLFCASNDADFLKQHNHVLKGTPFALDYRKDK